MNILAMDTSSVTACVGIVNTQQDRILSEVFADVPLTHSQTMLPMTKTVLTQAGTTLKDVDLLAVCNGPGSFTGVRIGVAAVKGLGFEQDRLCAPVSTLEALACGLAGVPFCGIVCAAMDARCRQVYTANFLCENGTVTRMTEDEAISLDACLERLKEYGRPVLFVGDGALLCQEAAKDPSWTAAPPHLRYARARGIALAAKRCYERGETVSASALQPLYLRLPQAERELKARQALKG